LLPDLAEDVSASAIRAALHRGGVEPAVIDPRVAAYIRTHGLYREDTESAD
jgi:nicotinic acid mononucleotide adenylyltransferase